MRKGARILTKADLSEARLLTPMLEVEVGVAGHARPCC